MVKDPENLWHGRKIENFSLLPREVWGNWLICGIMQNLYPDMDITFVEDDEGDGIILNRTTGEFMLTEHVSALEIPKGKKLPAGEQRIIHAINLKIARGADYAQGKHLVVFFDGAGEFYRNKIRESIYGTHNFNSIFCIGLLTSGPNGYEYIATEFKDSSGDRSVSFRIKINADFTDWETVQIVE